MSTQNIRDRHNTLRQIKDDLRDRVCVNACAGMTDPVAEIQAMREAIKAANEGLHSAMQYILSLPYFGNLEELGTTEKVQSALGKLKPFLND